MKLEVNGLSTPALQEHVEARLRNALNQYRYRVGPVRVRLDDINGPRGGVDQMCHVSVQLKPSATILVTEVAEDMYAAVSRAADRLKVAVGRVLERRRGKRPPLRVKVA